MIKIDQIPFETVDKAFDFISRMDGEVEEGSLFYLPLKTDSNWSFAAYSPERVNQLSQFYHMTEPPLRQAYDEQLGLLELCSGDYANPRYVALTPDVDVGGLKREWLHGYCAAHGLAIEDDNPDICPADAFERGLEQALRQAAGEGMEAPLAGLAQPKGQEARMVKLINRDGSVAGQFDGEGDLFGYILQEAASATNGEGVPDWRFTYSSHPYLERLVREMGNKSLVFMAHQACQQKRALITVGAGDADNLSFFIATPDLNIAALRREWCKRYCAAHGLRIVVG